MMSGVEWFLNVRNTEVSYTKLPLTTDRVSDEYNVVCCMPGADAHVAVVGSNFETNSSRSA